jgi:tRNA1Val (adenine37-N6)-methyltransferase
MERGPLDGESLDLLAGSWRIFQLVRGHRFSTDDLACAWRASLARPSARRLLDLGSGIGSVGLSTLWRVSRAEAGARLWGVEAQEISVGLARRTAAWNGLADRVSFVHADLRDAPHDGLELAGYDLITGSPPYIPPGHGVLSPIPQRAGARIELRGSVYDYCRVARLYLAPGGRFSFVMASGDPRTADAPVAAGLVVVERFEIVFRDGRPPHICVVTCARPDDPTASPAGSSQLVVRDRDGVWTAEYLAFRQAMGAPSLDGRAGDGAPEPAAVTSE